MGYLSASLTHLQFPLSVFYSFQLIGLSSPWLTLFLGVLFFWHNFEHDFKKFSLSYISSLVYRNVAGFFILILCPATLLN